MIELLVAMGIFLLLSVMTFTLVAVTISRDRVRAGSRQTQSFLEGARDRAIYAGEIRGVRFLLDQNGPTSGGNPLTANSMVYLGAPGDLTGQIQVIVDPGTGFPRLIDPISGALELTEWDRLRNRGLIPAPAPQTAQIRIDEGGGQLAFYTVFFDGANWLLTKDFAGTTGVDVDYEMDLQPAVLPNQEPSLLPAGVAIDLESSQLPRSWDAPAPFAARLDILFSPRGTVAGTDASSGLVHLVLRDTVDVDLGRPLGQDTGANAIEGDEVIVTVAPTTGNVSSHPVQPQSAGPDQFFYAETGEVAQ